MSISVQLFPVEILAETTLDLIPGRAGQAEILIEQDLFGHSLPASNIQVGIEKYGAGVSATAKLQVGFKPTFDAPIQIGIKAIEAKPPQNVLACHLGQGAILFTWDHPENYNDLKPTYYEVWASDSLNGNYFLQQDGIFSGSDRQGICRNLPIGVSSYFKIRSVYGDGTKSDFENVHRGIHSQTSANFKVTAINGSKIATNAIFAAEIDNSDNFIYIQAPAEIEITC